jgi:hypothetical protein
MIKTISDKRIDWLVSHIVKDDNLMQLKPVLAGGSMLSVYRAYRLYDSDSKWGQLERAASFDRLSNLVFEKKIDVFGDIDAWFFKDSSLHSDGYGSWMISDLDCLLEDTIGVPGLPSPLGTDYRIVKTSKWANSFQKKTSSYYSNKVAAGGFVFQAIKKPISSIEGLFKTFDFTNCCVAYSDGVLYYDSALDSAFDNFRLRLNNPTNYKSSGSMSQRIYAGLRAFKYSKRYLLDFSPALSELIYQIYVDTDSIDYSEYQDKVALVNDVYGKVLMAGGDFKDMVRSFELNFKHFTEMKTFRGDYALFLINRKNLEGVKAYLDKDSTSLPHTFGLN